ncbi:ficolin-2-like [Asterias rubens]|uniref:ficolin-2-like n=1 Tax=Asterias rubens TaxID=7604 RepID=UPI0014559D15|nr:ficolin-2-like [Asterias rubens]
MAQFIMPLVVLVAVFLSSEISEVAAIVCTIGQEPNPNSNHGYSWVIPVEDPCKCTEVMLGGFSTHTPQRVFNVTYYDNYLQSNDHKEIKHWLNCTESLKKPKDCAEILAEGVTESGVYTIKPLDSGEPFMVYCDMETDGGGWTVFQRRQDGSVKFYRLFVKYSRGFGNLEGEFWLGNDNLHRLTDQGEYELRVDLSDFENESSYAYYDSFSIADESDKYRLNLGSFNSLSTAGDSLSYHNNCQFSTKDLDNDNYSSDNCAQHFRGSWWYNNCHQSNLNGLYFHGANTEFGNGIIWNAWKGYLYSLKTSEMKIRAKP